MSRVERHAFPGAQATYSDLPEISRSETIWLTSNDDRGDWITGVFAPGDPERKQCMIHFYGGTENLGRMGYLIDSCRNRGLSVLMFDYRGYGASSGRPREAAFYSDAILIYEWLKERYPEYRAIVSGRALGAAVAIHLAQHRECQGLVLFSPFANMMQLVSGVFPKDEVVIEEAMPFVFDNLETIRKVRCPILMVNGAEDATIPQHTAEELQAAVKAPLSRVDIPGVGHQNLFERGGDAIWGDMFKFINKL